MMCEKCPRVGVIGVCATVISSFLGCSGVPSIGKAGINITGKETYCNAPGACTTVNRPPPPRKHYDRALDGERPRVDPGAPCFGDPGMMKCGDSCCRSTIYECIDNECVEHR